MRDPLYHLSRILFSSDLFPIFISFSNWNRKYTHPSFSSILIFFFFSERFGAIVATVLLIFFHFDQVFSLFLKFCAHFRHRKYCRKRIWFSDLCLSFLYSFRFVVLVSLDYNIIIFVLWKVCKSFSRKECFFIIIRARTIFAQEKQRKRVRVCAIWWKWTTDIRSHIYILFDFLLYIYML